MEKIDRDFEDEDYYELDDVLDRSYFSQYDDMEDLEEDESNYDNKSSYYRSISDL